MLIDYKDYYPNGIPDYQGTGIAITAENDDEARRIDLLIVAKTRGKGWYYKYKRSGRQFAMIGYDGFLASLVEEVISGDRNAWQKGHPRQKVVL